MAVKKGAIKNKVENLEFLPWHDLSRYDFNTLKEKERVNIDRLKKAIIEKGFCFPFFVWQGNDFVIDGTGRFKALKALEAEGVDIPDLPIVNIQAKTLDEAKQLVLQASSDFGEITKESLDLFGADFEIDFTTVSIPSIEDLNLEPELIEPEGDPDDCPDVPEEPTTVLGDIYEIGDHRLMCGDSTSIDTVEKLMDGKKADMVFTDPPYGVDFQSNMRKSSDKFDVLKNDDIFLTEWVHNLPLASKGFVFVWTSFKVVNKWIEICSPIGDLTNMVIWDKGGGGMGDLQGSFATDFEIALVYNRGASLTGKRIGSVWSIGKDRALDYSHPTQKPVELSELAITHTTKHGDSMLDLFLGSGSTMVAAHKTGRKCYGMELDQHYCDVIVTRMKNLYPDLTIKRNGEEIAWPEKPTK